MLIISTILLIIYSLIAHRKTIHFKKSIWLCIGTSLCVIVSCLWLPAAGFYIVLLNMLLQTVYMGLYQGDSIWVCILQCLVLILPWIMVGDSGYAVLMEVLLFIGVQLRERIVQHRFESYSVNYQNKLLRNQVEEVQHIYMTMRGWRHDYHNHLQSLKAKLNQKQIVEAMQYLDELEQDLEDIHQIVESGNVNVDAILNSKLSLAIAQEIDVNVKVRIPKTLPISDIDCCVLLGNLIDNAIEACDKVEEKKFIRLYIGIHKKQLYMSITNATNEVVRKYDEEYITTKRGNHGHGLKRINKVVEKYNGYINRKNEPGVFVCEIMLPI